MAHCTRWLGPALASQTRQDGEARPTQVFVWSRGGSLNPDEPYIRKNRNALPL